MREEESIASLVFSAFFSGFSASSAVRNEWIAALPRWEHLKREARQSWWPSSLSASSRGNGSGQGRATRLEAAMVWPECFPTPDRVPDVAVVLRAKGCLYFKTILPLEPVEQEDHDGDTRPKTRCLSGAP
jgi:hypothetical protein